MPFEQLLSKLGLGTFVVLLHLDQVRTRLMKAMLLDLDDTLLDDSAASKAAFSAFLAFHAPQLDAEPKVTALTRWQELSSLYWQQFERGELTFAQQRRRRVADFLRTPLNDEAADIAFEPYRQVYESSWALLPGVADFLQDTADIPKIIITNGEREQQLRKISACNLHRHVQGAITPMDCGHWKPHPGIFRAALQRLSQSARDCLMVGDDLRRDIEPARLLGLQTLHVVSGTQLNNWQCLLRASEAE